MEEKLISSGQSPTPYDDVFRTMLVDCSKLVIPVINEVFDKDYTGNEEIRFRQNEHFEGQQDGQLGKIITDSSFQIVGKDTKSYLFECQSTADSSMLIRIFEYATQIALDSHTMQNDRLTVEIPHSALLFLRSTEKTPDLMSIEMRTPGGNVEFEVPVMKVKNYSIDEVFKKELFFLIPFYIFIYEARFKKMEEQGEGLDELREDYRKIFDSLDAAAEKGLISAFARKTIFEMSNKVLEKIAVRYDKVLEGVKSVMGGRVLEHEAKNILNEGKLEQAKETAFVLRAMGMNIPNIAKAVNVTEETVKTWFGVQTA